MSTYEITAELLDAQMKLEEESVNNGVDAAKKKHLATVQNEEQSKTQYGMTILRLATAKVAEAIQQVVVESKLAGRGRRGAYIPYLEEIKDKEGKPDFFTTAWLALSAVIDGLSKARPQDQVAVDIGTRINNEAWMRVYKESKAKEYERTLKTIKERTDQRGKDVIAKLMARRNGVDRAWPETVRGQVGHVLIDLLEPMGLFTIERRNVSAGNNPNFLIATEDFNKRMDAANAEVFLATPQYMPTIIPPKPWTAFDDGGYWSGYFDLPFVIKSDGRVVKDYDLTNIYDAINLIQETPWRVNTDVLTVLDACLDDPLKRPFKGLPALNKKQQQEMPSGLTEEERVNWKREQRNEWKEDGRQGSKRGQMFKVRSIAHKFKDHERIFFPHRLDYRGRAYAIPMYLNPQGDSLTKSLLRFADTKPITNEVAAGYLAMHGANEYGLDKKPMDERIAWAFDEIENIRMVVADPLGEGFQFWQDADKPWTFLAWAYDWVGFMNQGYGYESHTGVAFDGACNGIQHYSAALLDPEGAKQVNLVPSTSKDHPADIYMAVAKASERLLRVLLCLEGPANATVASFCKEQVTAWEKTKTDEEGNPLPPMDWKLMAGKWLQLGVSRDVAKRPTMTTQYGGKATSQREYIQEKLKDPEGLFRISANLDGRFRAATFLQPIMNQAIADAVPAARRAMTYLQDMCRLVTASGKTPFWVTPDGFPVAQRYMIGKGVEIKTTLRGKQRVLTLREDTNKVDRMGHADGIAPNWVHSLDATALRTTTIMAHNNGVTHFAMIHDSFGTHAADAATLLTCTKEAFIKLYTDNDPLADFHARHIGLIDPKVVEKSKKKITPELPQKGDLHTGELLDLSGIRDSEYFFA